MEKFLKDESTKKLLKKGVREETIEALERYIKRKKIEVEDVNLYSKYEATLFGRKRFPSVDIEITKSGGEIIIVSFYENKDKSYYFDEILEIF